MLLYEISAHKAELWKALSVEEVLNPNQRDQGVELERLIAGAGPSVVIECVGLAETFRNAAN